MIIGLMGIFLFTNLAAQQDPGKVIEQMQKFKWMVGDWKGEAWYLGRDQQKTQIVQKEHIITRLDGAIITMEGTGYFIPEGSQEEKIVFQAFGIFTYDQNNSKFVLRAYQGGNFIDSDFTSNTDGSFSWGFDTGFGKMHYTLRLTPEGKWNEVGEFSQDGTTWVKTFEMTLNKL
ncbi:MAG: hypothetical protein WAL29_09500 [Bacteroidales bacterium]